MVKKILICSLNDKMGGAEQVLKMIANYYIEQKYQIDVFFLTKHIGNLWDDVKDKVNLYYTKSESESKGLFQFYLNIRKQKTIYDYGYTSHVYLNSFIGLLRKLNLAKINHLIGRDSHSYFLVETGAKRLIYNTLINMGYRGLDLLICQTDDMKQQFIFHKPKLSKKIKVKTIPNPVSISLFGQTSRDESIIPQSNYIVSAGRLIKIKGFDILIKAFAKLNLKHYKLVVLGEGEERKNLEQLIRELNLEDQVELVGFVDNVYEYFSKANMCVVSSIKEGFPNVLLQMMSQNTKIVSTRCAGGIDDIEGIYTCNPGSDIKLYEQMKKCLQDDTSFYRVRFDEELRNRSIDKFIDKIDMSL